MMQNNRMHNERRWSGFSKQNLNSRRRVIRPVELASRGPLSQACD